jgi:hypothetical protein
MLPLTGIGTAGEDLLWAYHRLDIAWFGGVIAQHFPGAVDRGVDPLVNVDHARVRPQTPGDFLARDQGTAALNQQNQEVQGCGGNARTVLAAKFETIEIEFEGAKRYTWRARFCSGLLPVAARSPC